MSLDVAWARVWVERSAQVVAEHREELTALDAAIGDGDHGDNLDRGLSAAADQLRAADESGEAPATPGAVLASTAAVLLRTVGGASGPLLGTALLRAARGLEAAGTVVLASQDVVTLLETMADAVAVRGHAEEGDKTMLDVWRPAARAAAEAAGSGVGPVEVLRRAAGAGHAGAQATREMRARKGRASYLGDRSRGHLDPGACSSGLLLQAAVDAAAEVGE